MFRILAKNVIFLEAQILQEYSQQRGHGFFLIHSSFVSDIAIFSACFSVQANFFLKQVFHKTYPKLFVKLKAVVKNFPHLLLYCLIRLQEMLENFRHCLKGDQKIEYLLQETRPKTTFGH